MLTIPHASFTPYLPPGCAWIRGQLEEGRNGSGEDGPGGYLHWQIIVAFTTKRSINQVTELFGPFHAELTRSSAAGNYVWKEETRVPTTQFELGAKPVALSNKTDWDQVWRDAQSGELERIPPFVRVKSYRTIRAIASDYARPEPAFRTAKVFWGPTGTGKSSRAWEEATSDAYIKSARTKFWDGYQGETSVIIDEFRGNIDVSYLLTWFDRYPVRVEIKGSSTVLRATRFWVCSNLHPRQWYPDLDEATYLALERRLEIIEMNEPILPQ